MSIWEFLKWSITYHPIITIILFIIVFNAFAAAWGSMFENGGKK